MCLYDFECENEHMDWNIDAKLVYKTKSVLSITARTMCTLYNMKPPYLFILVSETTL